MYYPANHQASHMYYQATPWSHTEGTILFGSRLFGTVYLDPLFRPIKIQGDLYNEVPESVKQKQKN